MIIFPFVLHRVSYSIHKAPNPAALHCLFYDDVTMNDSTGLGNYTDSKEIISFAFPLPLHHFRHLLPLPPPRVVTLFQWFSLNHSVYLNPDKLYAM